MSDITTELGELLGTVLRPGDFCTAGSSDMMAPGLEIEGLGPVALPLLPMQAEQIIASAELAPYGRGEETIVDPAVRRCWQIGPERVRMTGRHWPDTLRSVVDRVRQGLGVDAPVSATFYKMILYDRGSFFIGHRDTEKQPGMFATLLLVLPSRFTGGELLVRHKDRERRLDLLVADPAELAFAAFYADCVHEVLPVTDGHRLTLVYNLIRQGTGPSPTPPEYQSEQAQAAELLRSWRAGRDDGDPEYPRKLIYLLEHAYTQAELGFDRLKGVDAAVAKTVAASASAAQCEVSLALLTIEESGAAEYRDDYNPRRRHHDDDDDEFEAGDVDDRTMTLSAWRRLDGSPMALGEIPARDDEFTPPDAQEDLSPDEEHFREATGNEGATFERTYRRAALVLWPDDGLFDILGQAGLKVTLPYLEDMIGRLGASGGANPSAAWLEAHALARVMVAQWPVKRWYPFTRSTDSDETRMLVLLTRLGDAVSIEQFLTQVTGAGCFTLSDCPAVVDALDHLPLPLAAGLVERIVSAGALGACANLVRRLARDKAPAWAAHLTQTGLRLIAALPGDEARPAVAHAWRVSKRIDAHLVADLMTGLEAIDPGLCQRAIHHILACPVTYDMDEILVPALRELISNGSVAVATIARLRAACLAHLRARIAEKLAPPADWSRPNRLGCDCPRCQELARFLADPAVSTWVLKASQADRTHVQDTITKARCDVDTRTETRGRPYSLVCDKNQASYDRRARQREQDLADAARFETWATV